MSSGKADFQKIQRILIWEPRTGGHRDGHARALMSYLDRNAGTWAVRWAVSPDLQIREAEGRDWRVSPPPGVDFRDLTPAESSRVRITRWGFSELAALRQVMQKWKPDVTLIMDVTPVETALCFRTLPGPIAFILFVQYPEIPPVGRYRIKRWVKEWKTRLWLARQNVRAVFLLNGERACDYLNRRFPRTPIFQPVPEPLDSYPEDHVSQLRQTLAVPDGTVVLLYPGVLSRRKGIVELLGALHILPPAAAARAFFVFAGRVEETDCNRLCNGLRELQYSRPDIRLVHEDGVIPAGRLQAWMRQADWILLPYRRSDYSSGILGRAAEAGTPVLGPDDGLIGHLVHQYGLGLHMPITAAGICAGIEDALDGTFRPNPKGQSDYVSRSRPEEFARILIQGSTDRL